MFSIGGNADETDLAEARGFFNFVVFGVVAQRYAKEARRGAEVF
jgi:hypothetical protein